MSDELISEQTCERCRADLDSKLSVAERRLNKHSEEIDDWKEVNIRLTVIQETQTKLMEKFEKKIDEMEKQCNEKPKFLQSKAFERIVIIIGIIAIMITATAVGVNVAEYLPVLLK